MKMYENVQCIMKMFNILWKCSIYYENVQYIMKMYNMLWKCSIHILWKCTLYNMLAQYIMKMINILSCYENCEYIMKKCENATEMEDFFFI